MLHTTRLQPASSHRWIDTVCILDQFHLRIQKVAYSVLLHLRQHVLISNLSCTRLSFLERIPWSFALLDGLSENCSELSRVTFWIKQSCSELFEHSSKISSTSFPSSTCLLMSSLPSSTWTLISSLPSLTWSLMWVLRFGCRGFRIWYGSFKNPQLLVLL